MKTIQLVSTKKILPFEEFIPRYRFQYRDGIYQSKNDLIHLLFMDDSLSIIQQLLFSDNLFNKRINVPENFSVDKYRLIIPASCIEILSDIGWRKCFNIETFLTTVWSLIYEQGNNHTGFILKDSLFLFHMRDKCGNLYTASMMFQKIGAYDEYSINIGGPRMYEDRWPVKNPLEDLETGRNTFIVTTVKN